MTTTSLTDKYIDSCTAVTGFPPIPNQNILSDYDSHSIAPPGELVQVGDRYLHTLITGSGDQTIILEAGMGGCSQDWSWVQPELSKHAVVLSYDRAGFGWSKGEMKQRSCRDDVEELRAILCAKKLKPPYVLVGTSFGGMTIRLFASMYPDEVTGLLLVDSMHEGMNIKAVSPGYRRTAFGAEPELCYARESALQLYNAAPLRPSMPVIVLIAGKQTEEWKDSQQALYELTNCTIPLTVQDSEHDIQIHQPEAVIDAALSLAILGHRG